MPTKIKKRANGKYLLTVANGYDSNGKQKLLYRTVEVTSDREAEKEYIAFAAEVQRGEIITTQKIKLYDFAKIWFRDYCTVNLAPKTQLSYKNCLNNRIIPAMGQIDIKKLKPLHIINFINDLKTKGKRFDGKSGKISDAAIIYAYRVLSSMLKDAVQWQVIPSSPCDRVKPPRVQHKKALVLNEVETAQMIQCLENKPLKFKAIIILAIATGMRLGEIMGLKWSDIDFDGRILTVIRTNQVVSGRGLITKSPKNESSNRSITLPEDMIALLKQYKLLQRTEKLRLGDKWIDGGWVFTKWNGEPMYPTTPSQWFHKFVIKNKLKVIPFHGLRHTSATLLIAKGIPLKNVSSRLGHSDIRTTGNIYTHALESVDRKVADTMNTILENVKSR